MKGGYTRIGAEPETGTPMQVIQPCTYRYEDPEIDALVQRKVSRSC